MNMKQIKKQLILNIPYIVLGLVATNLGEMWRLAVGANASVAVDVDFANGRFRGFAQLFFGDTDGIGELAAVLIDDVHVFLGH